MLKSLTLAGALVLGVSSLALAAGDAPKSPMTTAQAPSTTSPSTAAPSGAAKSGAATGTTAGSGTSAMTESDIKKRLETQGYSQVSLKADPAHKGEWTGTAQKSGKQVQLHVDANGKAIEK
jgi:hypothetical protein